MRISSNWRKAYSKIFRKDRTIPVRASVLSASIGSGDVRITVYDDATERMLSIEFTAGEIQAMFDAMKAAQK